MSESTLNSLLPILLLCAVIVPAFLTLGICELVMFLHDKKYDKVKEKYKDLYADMVLYNKLLSEVCTYYNTNCAPIKTTIDSLAADNYQLPEEKEVKLRELRLILKEYMKTYTEMELKVNSLREDIQKRVDEIPNKDITMLWGKTHKNEED